MVHISSSDDDEIRRMLRRAERERQQQKATPQQEEIKRIKKRATYSRKKRGILPPKEPELEPTYKEIKGQIAEEKRRYVLHEKFAPRLTPQYLLSKISQKKLEEQEKQIGKLEVQKFKIKKTKEGYEFFKTPQQLQQEALVKQKQKISRFYDKPSPAGFAHAWTTGILSWEDPLSLKSLYYTFTGDRKKVIETKAKASLDLDRAIKEQRYIWKAAISPFATIGISYGMGAGVGAGVGVVKAAYPTIGKITEIGLGAGFGALAVKETYPVVKTAIETGKYADLSSHFGMMGIGGVAGFAGYRRGHAFGYGRTEAYLYGKHTYKAGSKELIRFKQTLKISRTLEPVKSHRIKALDIAKDIMRMDRISARKTLQFLSKHPKTTIGGSAASYTQIAKARTPRDIDLILSGGKKQVSAARRFFGKSLKTPKGEHRIDIHGKEFGKVGRYHEFGFLDKPRITIDKLRFTKAGELLFRKGVSAVKKETAYRHFKDIPDFITHAKSLITSAKSRFYTKWRGVSAEKDLQLFLHPERHPGYGKPESVIGKIIRIHTKKPTQPIRIIYPTKMGVGKSTYFYPKSIYPYYPTGVVIGGYYSISKYKTKPYVSKKITITKPPLKVPDIYKVSKTTKKPPYIPTKYPPSYPPTKIPIIKPPMYPPTKTPIYLPTKYPKAKAPVYPPSKPPKILDIVETKKRKKSFLEDYGKEYKFRKFDIPNLSKISSEITKAMKI